MSQRDRVRAIAELILAWEDAMRAEQWTVAADLRREIARDLTALRQTMRRAA